MATAKAENTFTVFRRQVVQTGKFEPAEASCSVTVTLAGDEDQEAVANLIAEWGTTLEIANYEALGIGYEMTESGVRRLEKSISQSDTNDSVAPSTSGNQTPAAPAIGGSGLDSIWRDLMDNKAQWWDPNWEKKLDPNANFNKNGPDYKRRADGKGIWLTKKDGSSLVPDWFVCPFTGKSASELAEIGTSIRA
mgnify:FL=1|jgi:hypothetical protein|tara:strand:+ start:2179 stop:2757 length:579 start_codon:yes stop_codon:yes gene_type:complete